MDALDSSSRPATVSLIEAMSRLPGPQGERSVELFTHGSLSVKIYAPRGNDPQTPHTRDEIYVVAQGNGEFVIDGRRSTFKPGDFLFAPAGVNHRFENFTEDFFTWVMYYGPEGGEASGKIGATQ